MSGIAEDIEGATGSPAGVAAPPPAAGETTGSADAAVAGVASGRIASLDAFRGLTIAGMILVNNPGSWSYIYPPLAHAAWHGWTPTDLIFPYFLFILGVAIPFSFRRRIEEGAEPSDLLVHIARRSLVLVMLGLAMRIVPDFDLAEMRWPGVLQRIGLVYFAAAALYVLTSRRTRWVALPLLLLGYWALMALAPVPGYGAGDLSPEGNLAAWIDRLLMEGHLYQEGWDPEGLLSTLPAIGTALIGIATGERLLSGRDRRVLATGLLTAGAVLVPAGLAWGAVFPINKNLWTSSYVVFTAGSALLLFGILYRLIDVEGRRGPWERWMVVYGMNAIAVFVASGMLTKALTRIRVGAGEGTSLYAWVYEHAFRPWGGSYGGSAAFGLAYVGLWLGVAWLLHARRVYIKI